MCLFTQDNNPERAVDWIFSHADDLNQPMETDDSPIGETQSSKFRDGPESKFLMFSLVFCSQSIDTNEFDIIYNTTKCLTYYN